jgi:F-type H+-transporting ATPase subunit gamma
VYGRKGYTWLGRRGYRVERFYADPPLDALDFTAARIVAKDLVDSFLGGKIDEVKLVFTSFVSAARFQPRVDAFLPVTVAVGEVAAQERAAADAAAGSETQRGRTDYLLEPDPETLFNRIIPRYLEIVVFNAMLSSLASEQASRRMAMKGATDAASRMGKELKRVYNRARQESITKELLDIVGGANAVS